MSSKLRLMAIPALVLLVTACSSSAAEQDVPVDEGFQETGETSEGTERSRDSARLGDGGIPVVTQLMLGTLRLESTDLAVDSAQAAELAPLWKALRSLTNSDTAAEVEIEAVIEQIQESMTGEQIEAITTFELTQEDMQTIIQELGLEFGPPEGFDGEGFNPDQFRRRFEGGSPGGGGAPFGGEGGPSGGFQGSGGEFDPEAFATQRAEQGFEGFGRFGRRAGAFLFEPLIDLLEERAGLEDV